MAESRENSDSGSNIDDGSGGDTEKPVSKPQLAKAKVTKMKIVKPPTFYLMVIDALKTLDNKTGVSVIAIRSFILDKYPTVDPNNTKNRLKKALAKGLENGTIMRPKKSSADLEAKLTGRFRYDQVSVEKQEKLAKKEKAKAKAVESKPKPKSKPKSKPNSKVKAKSMSKTAYKKNEKSALKSIKQTPAKTKSKTPLSTKKKSTKSNTPKKTAPKKNLIEVMEKENKKKKVSKTSPKIKEKTKTATKKKATPKKTVSKKKAE